MEKLTLIVNSKLTDCKDFPEMLKEPFQDCLPDSMTLKTEIDSDKDGDYITIKGIGRLNLIKIRTESVPYTRVVRHSTKNSKGTKFQFESEMLRSKMEKIANITLYDICNIGHKARIQGMTFYKNGKRLGYATFVKIASMVFEGCNFSVDGGEFHNFNAVDLVKSIRATREVKKQ